MKVLRTNMTKVVGVNRGQIRHACTCSAEPSYEISTIVSISGKSVIHNPARP